VGARSTINMICVIENKVIVESLDQSHSLISGVILYQGRLSAWRVCGIETYLHHRDNGYIRGTNSQINIAEIGL
jgi:hypothetical protein